MKLKPFQRKGVDYLHPRKRALLGDEMGLGKTPQAVSAVVRLRAKRVLVVCPSFLRLNWKKEFDRWHPSFYKMNLQIIDNVGQTVYGDLVLCSFTLAAVPAIHKQLTRLKFDVLLIDESHYLKNPDAARTARILGGSIGETKVRGVIESARRAYFITGSPLVNHAGEIYTTAKRCAPDVLDAHKVGDYASFCLKFCYMDPGGRFKITPRKVRNAVLLKTILSTFMIRRKKADVLSELPPKTKQVIELGSSGRLRQLIKEEEGYSVADVAEMFGEALTADVEDVIDRDENPFDLEPLARLRHEIGLAKVPLILPHILNDLEQVEKIVIMPWHKTVIAALEEALREFGPVVVTGSKSSARREEAVERFQTDPTCRVFIGQMKAAGVGLTLTAASLIVFPEPWYVPGDIEQAIDRLHRIGQHDNVLAKFYVVPDCLDARILQTALDKQKYLDKVI